MNLASLLPAKLRPYAKAVVGLLGSVIAYFVYTDGNAEWVAPLVQLATVLGIYHADPKA